MSKLSPAAVAVFQVMDRYGGACPRHFANHDIYRYGARIFELRKLGWKIGKRRCTHHHHRKVIWEYYVVEAPHMLVTYDKEGQ